jgi:hypothetical protein
MNTDEFPAVVNPERSEESFARVTILAPIPIHRHIAASFSNDENTRSSTRRLRLLTSV